MALKTKCKGYVGGMSPAGLLLGLAVSVTFGFAATLATESKCKMNMFSRDLQRRANCPYYHSIDYAAHRKPAIIPIVKCECPGAFCCGSERAEFTCHEQRIKVVVAVRLPDGTYQDGIRHEIPVRCACAMDSDPLPDPPIYEGHKTASPARVLQMLRRRSSLLAPGKDGAEMEI